MRSKYTSRDLLEEIVRRGGDPDRQIWVRDTIGSTSSDLFDRLSSGAGPGSVVAAHVQTGGRGRRGREWHCPSRGNVCLSLALSSSESGELFLGMAPLAAGVAASLAVEEICGVEVSLKWPNDLILNGKKLGGILCEVRELEARPLVAVVGLGLNVGPIDFPPELADIATDLAGSLEGAAPDPAALSGAWVVGLEDRIGRLADIGRAGIVDEWLERAEPFGRKVKVGDVTGETVGLDGDGRLLIETPQGVVVTIFGGIVENIVD